MQKIRLLPLLLVPALLAGCSLTPPVRDMIDPEPKSATGTVTATGASVTPMAILKNLDAPTLTATGSTRFLESGIVEIGKEDAPHTLTVFTEYHCEYCNEFSTDMLPNLQKQFTEDGTLKVRIVPVVLQKYPNSSSAAAAILCAGKNGKAEGMHQMLVTRQNKHRSSTLEYAAELGMDEAAFATCLDAEDTKDLLQLHSETRNALGITLVPTLVLDNDLRTGLPLYADLRGWIEKTVTEQP